MRYLYVAVSEYIDSNINGIQIFFFRVQSKIGGLPINPSSQQLVKQSPPNSKYNLNSPTTNRRRRWQGSRRAITVGVLVFVNLINYMDRLTIAGRVLQVAQLLLNAVIPIHLCIGQLSINTRISTSIQAKLTIEAINCKVGLIAQNSDLN